MPKEPQPRELHSDPAFLWDKVDGALGLIGIYTNFSLAEKTMFRAFGVLRSYPSVNTAALAALREYLVYRRNQGLLSEDAVKSLDQTIQILPQATVGQDLTAPEIDPLQVVSLTHDANNLLVGLGYTESMSEPTGESSFVSQVSAAMNLNTAVFSFTDQETPPPILAFALRIAGIKACEALDDKIAQMDQEAIPTEFLEARSITRAVAGLPPIVEKVDLLQEVERFIRAPHHVFLDKNSLKKVTVQIVSSLQRFPKVITDRGALYRTLRNLLNDIATHAQVEEDTIPALINLIYDTTLKQVVLAVINPGLLKDEELSKIGRVVYSTQEGREHGKGKISISLMFRKVFHYLKDNLGTQYDQFMQWVDEKQWKNLPDYLWPNGRKGAVSWQMPFPVAA